MQGLLYLMLVGQASQAQLGTFALTIMKTVRDLARPEPGRGGTENMEMATITRSADQLLLHPSSLRLKIARLP